MKKVDHKKVLKEFYSPSSRKPSEVDVPEMNFLMIDGKGDPNTAQEYKDAIEALYAASHTLKFKLKKAKVLDFTVMPLEGLWWVEGEEGFKIDSKEGWCWTALIMQPEQVSRTDVIEAIAEVKEKKDPIALQKLRFESFREGYSVQIMHIGPWSEEKPTIDRLHAYAEEQGFKLRGKHHEIYLSDPRRTAPEKLKTVIRQPVA
ncbi:MAG: GyrI-like domain-containing protein [Candidatus Thorarchaeota archaeon]